MGVTLAHVTPMLTWFNIVNFLELYLERYARNPNLLSHFH